MNPNTLRRLIASVVISILSLTIVQAQPGVLPQTGSSTNITPVVNIAPAVFAAGQTAEAYLTITNGNPTSTKQIQNGDAFTITVDSGLSGGFTFAAPPLVNSATLAAGDFTAVPNGNQVVITYTNPTAKLFAPGDTLSLKVTFTATATLRAYKVTWQGPYVKCASNWRFNEVVARYTAVQVVAAAGGGGGGVTNVTASGPLESSGGAMPNISLTGVVPVASGGTGSATQNFVDLTSDQEVSGNKIFTGAINTNSQYKLNGIPFVSSSSDNLSLGADAGHSTGLFGGNSNTFLGISAGKANLHGTSNSFIGYTTGFSNTGGNSNSFIGYQAGYFTTNGSNNSFLGSNAGVSNTVGSLNTFIGSGAGTTITTSSNNTFIGAAADGVTGLTNATALGFRAKVTQNNSLVLGSINGINGATASTNVGIGVTAPTERLQVAGVVYSTTGGFKFPDGSVQISAAGAASLTASAPLMITTGTTPNISLHTVGTNNGGTGLTTTGAAGNYLRSNGTNWTSSALQATDLPAGSSSYIQNGTSQQASANFNISGDGTVGNTFTGKWVYATTHFGLGGDRILHASGTENLFLGRSAGFSNSTGSLNVFFGTEAGAFNNTGSSNSFFGRRAGSANTAGNNNSFFGEQAGVRTHIGFDNTFFGARAGFLNEGGNSNVFVGYRAGYTNTEGGGHTVLGAEADVGPEHTRATAIGFRAYANCDDCLVLGGVNGVNGAIGVNVGIGTTTPTQRLKAAMELAYLLLEVLPGCPRLRLRPTATVYSAPTPPVEMQSKVRQTAPGLASTESTMGAEQACEGIAQKGLRFMARPLLAMLATSTEVFTLPARLPIHPMCA
jgi:hypothetical protein